MAEINEIVSDKAIQGLITTNKEINAIDDSVIKINKNIESLIATLDKQVKSNENVAVAQKKSATISKEVDTVGQQLEKSQKRLKDLDDSRTTQIAETNAKIQQRKKLTKDEIILNDKSAGTIEKLAAKNRILEAEKRKLDTTTKAGLKRLKEINKEQDTNNKTLTESGNKLQKQKTNIGNYGSAFNGLLTPIRGAGMALKAFLANPVVAVLAAIVIAFKTLVSAMKRSEEGQENLNKVMGFLKAGLNVLLDIITNVANYLFKAFSDPKKAITDLWDAIKENLINRVTALPEFYKSISNTIAATFRFLGNKIKLILSDVPIIGKAINAEESKKNVEKALDDMGASAKKTGQALVQMITGITPEGMKKIGDAIKGVAKEMNEESKQGAILASKTDALKRSEREFIVEKEKIKTAIIKAREAAQDETISLEKRLELNKEAQNSVDLLYSKEIEFAKTRAAIQAEAVAMGASTSEDLKELETLKAQVFLKEQERANMSKRLLTEERTLTNRLNSETTKEEKARTKEQLEYDKMAASAAIAERQRQYERDIMFINATVQNEEEKSRRLSELDYNLVQEQIDNTSLLLTNSELAVKDRFALEEELKDKQLELDKIRIDSDNEVAENSKQNDEERRERALELAGELQGIANQVFEFGAALNSRKLSNLEEQQAAELANENLTAEQKEAIDLKYAKKKYELELKQAKADKAAALFNIAINTALAIAKITGQTGVLAPFAIPLAIASGALQAATVLAQPLPVAAFAEGVESTPYSGFVAGDKKGGGAARELMQLSTGQMMMVDKPTYFEGNKFGGAKVYTNVETERIMSQTQAPTFNNVSTTDMTETNNLLKKIAKNNQSKPIYQNGAWSGIKKGQTTTNYLNSMRNGRNI